MPWGSGAAWLDTTEIRPTVKHLATYYPRRADESGVVLKIGGPVVPEPTSGLRGWWKIGAGCLAVVALIVQAFREAVRSRPQ